ATEVRIESVQLSATARAFVDEVKPHPIRIIAHRPDKRAEQEYEVKERQAREDHSLGDGEPVLFLEVGHGDASEFKNDLLVRWARSGRRGWRCSPPSRSRRCRTSSMASSSRPRRPWSRRRPSSCWARGPMETCSRTIRCGARSGAWRSFGVVWPPGW